MKIELFRNKYYLVGDLKIPCTRVTSITDVINKPALLGWCEKVTKTACGDIACAVFDEAIGHDVDSLTFSSEVRQRIQASKPRSSVLENAAGIGQEVHHWIEWRIRRTLGIATDEAPKLSTEGARHAVSEWLSWFEANNVEPLYTECQLASMEYRYAGTADLIAKVNGTEMVVDWKTSSGIYDEHVLQVSAYVKAYNEMMDKMVTNALIVRVPKIPGDTFEYRKVGAYSIEAGFDLFLSAQQLYLMQNAGLEAFAEHVGEIDPLTDLIFKKGRKK